MASKRFRLIVALAVTKGYQVTENDIFTLIAKCIIMYQNSHLSNINLVYKLPTSCYITFLQMCFVIRIQRIVLQTNFKSFFFCYINKKGSIVRFGEKLKHFDNGWLQKK